MTSQRGDPDVLTVAIIKGAVEGEITQHFGSLYDLDTHLSTARSLGLIDDDEDPTDYARDVYRRHRLDQLPAGRAYQAWQGSSIVGDVVAELMGDGKT